MRLIVSLLFLATPLFAQCPPPRDHTAALDALYARIQKAPSESEGLRLGRDLWEYWADAPNEVAQEFLNRGMARRSGFDYIGALSDFDRLVAYCPDYAEGYNQRAFVNFLQNNYEAALPDLDRAIALSPRHLGAISGRMATLMALGREAEAQRDLRRALQLNPWLPERHLLIEGEKL